MQAGFARACITPPVGTQMGGFAARDREHGAESVHDDLYARMLYLNHDGEEALIIGFDLLFFSRENADRLKRAIGHKMDISPRQILLNASHSHVGPCVDTWGDHEITASSLLYMNELERAVITAALKAKKAACEVSVWAGITRTKLPVSRRKPNGKGGVEWRPYPEGVTCDHLPVCLFKDKEGRPVCLLYSVSCHPSTISGWSFSAEYPGVACDSIDEEQGATCSLFLQGAGGDTKPCVIADGKDELDQAWRSGNWDDVEAAGNIVADEVIQAFKAGLKQYHPALHTCIFEVQWPLQKLPDREVFVAALEEKDPVRRVWAQRQLELLDHGRPLSSSAGLLVQGLQLAKGLRIVAIEGELVGELGLQIIQSYGAGITIPLGYSNGTGLYLPNTRMLKEGGYEVNSYYEYGFAAPLALDTEQNLEAAISRLKAGNIG